MQALSCPKCGAPLPNAPPSCPYCGVGLLPEAPAEAPAARPARPAQPPPQLPAGWRLFRDTWHGFQVAHPPGWRVETNRGQISVREDVSGLVEAVIWPFRLPQPSSARQMAAALVAAGSKFAKGFQAWEQASAAPDSNRISLRTHQLISGLPVDGAFNILVEGQNCIISGYGAPVAVIAGRSPILSQVLASFRTIEMLPRQQVHEPKERAFHIWLPPGWKFEPAINRNTVSGMGLPQFSAAYDPQGRYMAGMLSQQLVYQELANAILSGFMGYAIAKYLPAFQYCTTDLAKQLAKGQKNFRLEAVTPRPDLAELEDNALLQMGYPAGTFETSVAVMETTYEENGARLRQRTRVGTQRQVKAVNYFGSFNPYWTVMLGQSYRAPDGELDAWEPILCGILDSLQTNPTWQQQEQQRVALQQQMVQNYIANAQADMARRRSEISQTLSETSSIINNAYWSQQSTYDRLSELRSDGMLGLQNVASDAGEVFKVPYGYDQYWVDGLGNLLGGSWMVQPGVNWKPLSPTGV